MSDLILEKNDAIYASRYIENYFSDFGRIDDYLRKIKLERMKKIANPLFGFSLGDDLFNDWSMSPEEMDIEIRLADSRYDDLLEITTSHAIEKSAPGRVLKLFAFEKNTGKILGFIRVGSCTINSKPRNDFLGQPLNTYDLKSMQRFNEASCMGTIIVPVQPFGFNCAGGKLLAAICCSHEVREMFNQKYNSNICHFETTSLYGSSKSASQYDGMKPMLKFYGLTDSDFTPLLNDEKYKHMKYWFADKNGGKKLETKASSIKLSVHQKMFGIIKKSLNQLDDKTEYKRFVDVLENAKSLTERKRFFISNYGFKNTREFILGKTDTLEKAENFDRYYLKNLVEWWKKKAMNRWKAVSSDGRLRKELEIWSENENIDIIRGS